MELKQALEELRKGKERKFDQSLDLIVNLKGIDTKKTNISLISNIPHKVKEKKVCGFLTKKSELVRTVTKPDFEKYKDKSKLKSLVDEFDFFIAHASLMPSVATVFGKALGPAGKMPSPQLGIIIKEDDDTIKNLIQKIEKSVKIRLKESSIKVSAGKESMSDEKIMENIQALYKSIVNAMPSKNENIKNAKIKLTMSKSIEVSIK